MRVLTEAIEAALRTACSRSRSELVACAERNLGELGALRQRDDSEHARLEQEPSVGRALGPLGRSAMRTDVFAALQHDANAAAPASKRGARLRALERELEQALAGFRGHTLDPALETLDDDSVTQALEQYEARQASAIDLVGKVREAQLHLDALYRQNVHAPYFEAFGLDSLDEDERRYLAPLGFLAVDPATGPALASIVRLVSSRLPLIVVRVCRTRSITGAASPELPLPYAALAFSPQCSWLQTTWEEASDPLPPLLAEMLAALGHSTGPALADILACDSARQVELAEASGVWPTVAYLPDAAKAGGSAPMVRWSPPPERAGLSPADFAWELLASGARRDRFVELQGPIGKSGAKRLEDYLALSREARQSAFPVFQPDGKLRMVPADVLRYCDRLQFVNGIWERLGGSPAEPDREDEKPTVVTPPTPEKPLPDEAMRTALERILLRLTEPG